jgi:hypothetical protein
MRFYQMPPMSREATMAISLCSIAFSVRIMTLYLIESHGVEVSNEDLMELEAVEVEEQTEDEQVEEPQHFSTKQMPTAFCEIAWAVAQSEKMGCNSYDY